MGSLDVFLADIATSDTKKKLQIGESIVNYLGNPDNSIGTSQLSRCCHVQYCAQFLGIWIRRIHMFLSLPDPDQLVRRCGSGSGSVSFPFLINVS
jgi:hypothetical protein